VPRARSSTSPGTKTLRSGEQVSAGRRKEFAAFGWDEHHVPDPQAQVTYERSRLRSTTGEHAQLLDWYRRLMTLRAECSSLRDGNRSGVRVRFDEERGHLALHRGPILIACNLRHTPTTLHVGSSYTVVLASEAAVEAAGEALYLPHESVAILVAAGGGADSRPESSSGVPRVFKTVRASPSGSNLR
jgi:maltooligosyltrehalose trehalohydrolase